MTNSERASQVWGLLALAARNRQTLTYEMVGPLVGLPRQAVGRALHPVQNYSAAKGLPPLTALVVGSRSGLPSDGCVAAADAPPAQARVFATGWLDVGNPGPGAFEAAPPALTPTAP